MQEYLKVIKNFKYALLEYVDHEKGKSVSLTKSLKLKFLWTSFNTSNCCAVKTIKTPQRPV